MNRLLHMLTVVAAAASLIYVGFYLTGFLAARVDPHALGMSASAVFAQLMFVAWGLPAIMLWLVAGYLLKRPPIRDALFCALVQILMLSASGLLVDPLAGAQAPGSSSSELFAWIAVLFWPALFVGVLSPLGVWAAETKLPKTRLFWG